MAFNTQPTLTEGDLIVRPMAAADHDGLAAAAADPLIWAGHPVKDRHKREVFDPYFDFLLDSGSAMTFVERASGRIIGCSRFYIAPDAPEAVSIGFTFLARDHWGGETNRIVKRLMLNHIFEHCDEAWFHIGVDNLRSQKATMKLGARYVDNVMVDLGVGEADWRRYRLRREEWRQLEQGPAL